MTGAHLLALLGGIVLGALAALLWRARREQAMRVETEILRARLDSQAEAAAARERDLALLREQMRAAFGDLARDSLKSNSELFLQVAAERMARQQSNAAAALKERETAIEGLVQPIREALARTESQVQAIERERIDAFATLKTQIDSLATGQTVLSRETRNLVTALRRPEVRGQWGELTLRRLVELSGMTLHVDFTEQHVVNTDAGTLRPDMVVHMPERRDLVVDVKTPLDAYLAAVEAQTEEERGVHLKRHSSLVGSRIRDLSSKRYWAQFEQSPEFVILFLPGDQFLSAALQENPALIEEALRQNVMLATPTSLVALLKAVAYGWNQSRLADSAQEVRRLGEDIYKRLAVFGEHLSKLGRSLGSSVESFNRAVGSLEQQVLPAARRFPELGLGASRTLDVLEPVQQLARTPREADEDAFAGLKDSGDAEEPASAPASAAASAPTPPSVSASADQTRADRDGVRARRDAPTHTHDLFGSDEAGPA